MNENISLGEILRTARQKRRLSISQIAETTRLKATMIEDLERNDFSHVPAAIYGRSFIRMYAELVGLDPHPLVEEYMRVHAVSHPAAHILDPALAAHAQRSGARSMRRHNWASLWDTFRRNLEQLGADLIDRIRARRTASAYRVRTHRSIAERLAGIPWAAIVVVAAVAMLLLLIVLNVWHRYTMERTTHPDSTLNITNTHVSPSAPLRLVKEPPTPYLMSAPSAHPVAR